MKTENNFIRRATVALAALATLVAAWGGTAVADESSYSDLVVFGDSLEDPGNAFVLTGDIATQPFQPIPASAYAIGGHHFSNGRTWVEQLGRHIGLLRSTGPAFRNPAVASNYAIGGSRARDVATSPTASQQVGAYLAYTGGTASADALYVVGFGGNDIRDALSDPANAPTIIGEAAAAVVGQLATLCQAGAEEFLIANVPNLGVTPAIQAAGEPAISFATYLSWTLNALVQSNVAGAVQPACPNARFRTLDLFALSSTVVAYPQGFGFVDAQPCLVFGTTGQAVCNDPSGKFFWDAIHPTRAGHAILAEDAIRVIGAQ